MNEQTYLLTETINIVTTLIITCGSFVVSSMSQLNKGKFSLHDIAAYIEEARVCRIKGLTGVKTIDELFGLILPHNDYLNCELLEMIVEKYLGDDDITKVKAHIDKVKLFKCTTPIKALKNNLQ